MPATGKASLTVEVGAIVGAAMLARIVHVEIDDGSSVSVLTATREVRLQVPNLGPAPCYLRGVETVI
jgi:hypothetical protein